MRTVIFIFALLAATMASAQFVGAVNVINERGQASNRFMDARIDADGVGSIVKYESVFVKVGERVKYLDYTLEGAKHTIYVQRDANKRCELVTHWSGESLMYIMFIAWSADGHVYDRWQWFPNCETALRKSTAVN